MSKNVRMVVNMPFNFRFPVQPMERGRILPHALKHPVEELTSLYALPNRMYFLSHGS